MGNGIGVAQGNLDTLTELPNGMSIDGHQPAAGTDLERLLGNRYTILLDPLRREVYVNHDGESREIHLGRTQFNLLEYLMNNAGRAVSYDEISKEVLGYDVYGGDFEQGIRDQINHLRKKLGQERIQTVYGFGYKFIGAQNKG